MASMYMRVFRLTDEDITQMADEYYDDLIAKGTVQDTDATYGLVIASYTDGLRRGQREEK